MENSTVVSDNAGNSNPAVKTNEQYAQERADKISRSKIFGNGTIPVPYGILDILFYNKETKTTTQWTGNETGVGQIMILLPFRTERNLSRWALYSIPSDWKMKFRQGQQVYAIIADGYVKKLIPAGSMGNTAMEIRPAQAATNAASDAEKANLVNPKEETPKNEDLGNGPSSDGFEDSEENPF